MKFTKLLQNHFVNDIKANRSMSKISEQQTVYKKKKKIVPLTCYSTTTAAPQKVWKSPVLLLYDYHQYIKCEHSYQQKLVELL